MNRILLFFILLTSINAFSQGSLKLDLTVVNEYTKESISFVDIKLVNLSTNQIIRKKTNFNGELKLDIQVNMQYRLFANYVSDSTIVIFNEKNIDFNTQGVQSGTKITSELKLRPVFQKEGLKYLDEIGFDIFTYHLDKIGKAKLDNVIALMNEYPELKLEVAGFASCNLSEDDANSVSVERARTTFTYLTDAGIDYTRIQANAWGKEKSIAKCTCTPQTRKDKPCTKKHHIQNSRVSLVFK